MHGYCPYKSPLPCYNCYFMVAFPHRFFVGMTPLCPQWMSVSDGLKYVACQVDTSSYTAIMRLEWATQYKHLPWCFLACIMHMVAVIWQKIQQRVPINFGIIHDLKTSCIPTNISPTHNSQVHIISRNITKDIILVHFLHYRIAGNFCESPTNTPGKNFRDF